MRQSTYSEVRAAMQPGDVIAFSGSGRTSNIIKRFTRSTVSHVGAVLRRTEADMVELIESTSLMGSVGVQINLLSERLDHYGGNCPAWWLPLRQEVRIELDMDKWHTFMLRTVGRGYDFEQAAKSGVDVFDRTPFLKRLTLANEDFTEFFCSELVAAALEDGGGIGEVNASEITPADLCKWDIFEEAVQVQGEPRDIPDYGSVEI